MVELARLAERNGFTSVWVAETRLTRDGVAPTAIIAGSTERIRVGTGILNVYTRGPVLTAITFLSLDEIAPGRILMGLGTGSPLVLAPQGVSFEKPLTRLRETISIVRALHRGEEVHFHGQTLQVNGARLEVKPVREHIPLYLGVTGPRALETSGELADGVMMNAFLPTSYTRRALERVRFGAEGAGRRLEDVDLAGALVVSVDGDGDLARDRARQFVGLYLSLFPNIARETEVDAGTIEQVRMSFRQGGMEAAAEHISDEIVNRLTCSGTPEECRQRIEDYRQAGLQEPILFPLEPNVRMAIEELGP